MESNLRQSFLQQLYGRLQSGLATLAGSALEVLGQATEGGELRAQPRVLVLLADSKEKILGAMKGFRCVFG